MIVLVLLFVSQHHMSARSCSHVYLAMAKLYRQVNTQTTFGTEKTETELLLVDMLHQTCRLLRPDLERQCHIPLEWVRHYTTVLQHAAASCSFMRSAVSF